MSKREKTGFSKMNFLLRKNLQKTVQQNPISCPYLHNKFEKTLCTQFYSSRGIKLIKKRFRFIANLSTVVDTKACNDYEFRTICLIN